MLLRQDDNFRRFVTARLVLAMAGMGTGFVTVAAVQRWSVPDETVGIYTAVLLIGQAAGNLVFGLLADRVGHKVVLEISGFAVALAFAIAWLAPAPGWYYVVFGLLGIFTGGKIVSGILIVLEFSPPDKRPTYVGLINTAVGLVGAAAPLAGAGLANVGYGWLFAVSSILGVTAWLLMRWRVREPRRHLVSNETAT